MKCVLGIFLSVVALTSATLQNSIDLANNNNATSFTKFVDAAGLTDILREQGMYCCSYIMFKCSGRNRMVVGFTTTYAISTYHN